MLYGIDTTPETSTPSPKSPLLTVLWVLGMLAAAAALVFCSRAIANWYLSRTASTAVTCAAPGVSHFVYIQDGKATPPSTSGLLCDTLTIINKDPKLRVIAFGPHDHHIVYDGVSEQTLAENQSMTITLNKIGTFTFHDHIDDTSVATFIVVKR